MQDANSAVRPVLLLWAFIAALVMAPVAPEAGNIVFLGVSGVCLLLMRPRDLQLASRPVVWMPLLGLAILLVCYGLSAGLTAGLQGSLIFAPMLAIWPLLASLSRARATNLPGLAVLSLAGAAGAAAIALDEFLSTGTLRAGASVANPIHFADVALASGFLATIGLVQSQSSARYLYLLGPVFALVAVVLSGTRGAVLAWLAMIGIAVGISVWLRLVSWRWLASIAAAAFCIGILALLAGASHLSGVQRVLADLTSIAAFGLPTDSSTAERLHMYEGALAAFLQSPLIGHGPFGYVEAAAANARVPLGGTPHLHSDLANFAASGGALGLLAYSLFLLAPLVEVWRGPVSSTRRGLVVVFASLTVGYFVMGLTNAVIGILTLTVLYAASAVIAGSVSLRQMGASTEDTGIEAAE